MAINLKDLKKIRDEIESASRKALSNNDLQKIGNEVVKEMKEFISGGISPIQGKGRFPGYKDPKKYPANQRKNYPRKRARPVNLELSGDFLKSLSSKPISGGNPKIEIGYSTSESIKEQGHRDGANGQPKRPTIPEGTEKFNKSIEKNIIEGAREAISRFLKKNLD